MMKKIKEKANKRYEKLKKFYSQFEVSVPSLEYTLYKKYTKNRWLTFLLLNSFYIGFYIFWALSLYYVASVSVDCHNQIALINQYFNTSNLNFSEDFFKNLTVIK